MALSYVGGTSGTSGNVAVATYSVSLTGLTGGSDSAPQEGDLVLVVTGWYSTSDDDPGVTTAGYTELCDLLGDDTRKANVSVSYKIMGATPDTSVTVRSSNVANWGAATAIHVWRGVDAATPIDVAVTTATALNGSHINSPAITPASSGCVILSCGGTTSASSGGSFTTPTGFANAVVANGATNFIRFQAVIASYDGWTSGAYDPPQWTAAVSSTADSWAAASVVLRPDTGIKADLTATLGAATVSADGTNPYGGVSDIIDAFEASDQLKWTESTETGHVRSYDNRTLSLKLDGIINHYSSNVSQTRYNATGDAIFLRLVRAPMGSADGGWSYFGLTADNSLSNSVMFLTASNNHLYCEYRINGARTLMANLTYNPDTHAWLRIRESGGTIYCETAPVTAANPPDAGEWVVRGSTLASNITGLDIAAARVIIGGGSWRTQALSQPYAEFDGLNTSSSIFAGLDATLAATTASIDGTAEIGTITINAGMTLGAASTSATAANTVAAAMSKALGATLLSGEATNPIVYQYGKQLGPVATDADADVLVAAQAVNTLGSMGAATAAGIGIKASMTATLGAASASSAASAKLAAAAGITLGAQTVAATASHPVAAAAAIGLGSMAIVAQASDPVAGSAAITLGSPILYADGGPTALQGNASPTLGAMSASGSGAVTVGAALNYDFFTLDGMTASGAGAVQVAAQAAAALGAMSAASGAAVAVRATSGPALGAMYAVGQAQVKLAAALQAIAAGAIAADGAAQVVAGAALQAGLEPLSLQADGINRFEALTYLDATMGAVSLEVEAFKYSILPPRERIWAIPAQDRRLDITSQERKL